MNRSFGSWLGISLAILAGACARSRSAPPEIHAVRAADIPTLSAGPWAFSYSPGTRAYRITRMASIQGTADSASRREVVSSFTHQLLTLDTVGNQLSFTAVVDTFAVTTQGVVGPPQSVQLPIQLSGVLSPAGISLESSTNEDCNAPRATAATDLYNLLAPFPRRLTKGAVWRDSITVAACQAGIPTTTNIRRTFSVSGEVVHAGQPLLLLTRADTISSRGTGAYDQHHMLVEATGTGSALYYLDTRTREVIHLVTAQGSQIRVTTSGRVHSFAQSVNQEFVRVR